MKVSEPRRCGRAQSDCAPKNRFALKLCALSALSLVTACCDSQVTNLAAGLKPLFAVTVNRTADVTYCTVAGDDLKMDIYRASNTAQNAPALMFIHGGGWLGGDKAGGDVGPFDFPRLAKKGFVVFSINYRVGAGIWPAYIEDAKCAIRHIRANAANYRIDPERIGVWGHSAGAHIAVLIAVTPEGVYEGTGGYAGVSSRVDAVATYEAPTDVSALGEFHSTSQNDVARVFGALATEASPISHVSADDVPLYIVHGTLDESIDIAQANKLLGLYQAAGAPVKMLTVANGGHYLTVPSKYNYLVATPKRAAITDSVAAFFAQHVK